MLALSALAWGGQTMSWLKPSVALRLNLMEAEEAVEPTYWEDVRGEASWDALTLWTMVAAGALLILDNPAWAYLGLVGGGTYVYFAGRGIFTRMAMQRRGLRIGSPKNVRLALVLLSIWGAMGLIMIAAAIRALPLE